MGNKRYKLILINPLNKRSLVVTNELLSVYPPISLGILAALTPSHWEVEILDEIFEPFQYREADLVAFTALTANVNRAYEIAGIYRRNGIPTVLGGIHASMMPSEAALYVDTIVKGEAESIWENLIRDFEHGQLKDFYEGELLEMKKSPMPRIDLYHPGYGMGSIQTTRGCPMTCEFCSVHIFNGKKYRFRPLEDVIKEYTSIPQERVAFVDDNLTGYSRQSSERIKTMCRMIIDSGIRKQWFCSASMNVGEDTELLHLMSAAGCQMIFLGIESEVIDQLAAMNKSVNYKIGVENFDRIYKNIHDAGIAVLGAFIFGLESDTAETIRNRADYILNSDVDAMQVTVLTPLPGTVLYDRLKTQNRLLYTNYPKDWERCTTTQLTYKPLHMDPDEFNAITTESWEKLYNSKALTRRIIKTTKMTRNPEAAKWAFSANVQYHNIFLEGKTNRQEISDLFS
ncbi:MAG: B12-binding domain-containing radical SAM protein [Bacteroidetes bacterium]|nr:B12-binding domain-containing radical SAM protein [Bacteroidota bacterium]